MPITKSKISYTYDLQEEFDKADVKPSKRKELSEIIGLTILDEIVSYLDKGISPVSGGKYKRTLSKEYKKQKTSAGKKSFADMQLTDSMLDNLKIDATKKDVSIKITDKTEKLKAYNHNKGDTLPVRQWLPDDQEDQTLKRTITKKIKDLIQDAS